MAWKIFLQFFCFILFCVSSRELPVDSRENSNISNQRNPMSEASAQENFDHASIFSSKNNTPVLRNDSIERWNHSRNLKTTTESYEDWWSLTTRRRIINHKDFPGVTGEGSWVDLSPNVREQKSLPRKPPTSSGVASSSWKLKIFLHHLLLFTVLCTLPFFRSL